MNSKDKASWEKMTPPCRGPARGWPRQQAVLAMGWLCHLFSTLRQVCHLSEPHFSHL